MNRNSGPSSKKSGILETKGSTTKNQRTKDKNVSKSKITNNRLKVLSVDRVLGEETDLTNEEESSFLSLPPPFAHRECNAHTWTIPVMIKYLSEEMELGRICVIIHMHSCMNVNINICIYIFIYTYV
jgi:hypothetical protein